ncbi:MAG: NUDIX domain-containing protein [Sedimentisphaerales bacterium]|nr:NUDIX domain-containing protein [Sedimentisphaerales bacterium]
MAQDELVLVIERSVYEKAGAFHGLAMDVDRYIERFFAPGVTRYMPRCQVETDPNFKQIIPYVLMTCDGEYLSYVRGKRAGETRLVGNRSIGIGGHINPADDMSLFDPYETYLNAVRREVEEEVDVETKHTDRVIALLNDDTNEVGQVHLGIVHLWTLDEPNVIRREQMITQLSFMTLEELAQVRDSMETWSQLCLEGLEEMAREQSGI